MDQVGRTSSIRAGSRDDEGGAVSVQDGIMPVQNFTAAAVEGMPVHFSSEQEDIADEGNEGQ